MPLLVFLIVRYVEDLPQLATGRKISSNPADWHCDDTNVTENLWLNLSTGHIGSGRQVGSKCSQNPDVTCAVT
jgi:hypothetical protein